MAGSGGTGKPSASCGILATGVACLEFHSKMNTLDMDSLALVRESVEKVKTDFSALVITTMPTFLSRG